MKITKELTDSLTLAFSKIAREKNKQGERIYSLGLGEPGFQTPAAIIEATNRAMQEGFTRYSNSLGLFELRERISAKLAKENNIGANVDNIVITHGAKQALLLALMAILEPGDEVINISPSYVSYIPQIKIAEPDSQIHNIDLMREDFSLNFDLIKQKLSAKTKAIIINSPNNPTGRMFSQEEMHELLNLVAPYKEAYILSDEIYEYLNFSSMQHYSVAQEQSIADRVFTINGFSKSFSMTGWRIGYMVVPESKMKIIARLLQHINTNIATFIQKGSCAAFDINKDFLIDYNAELKKSVDFVEQTVSQTSFRVVKPTGGFFAFMDISASGLTSDDFASRLINEFNVATTPGIAFGEKWNDHVRLSMAAGFDEVKSSMELILKFYKQL